MEPEHYDKNHVVAVRVTDPLQDASKNFFTYLVMGNDQLGTFEIRRRFNDFFYLREALRKKWPALYIPPIPEKKFIGGKDQQQIEYRRKFFSYFLEQLSKIKHMFYSPIVQEFLRNKSTDMEKLCQTTAVPKTPELIEQYKKVFSQVNFKVNQAEMSAISSSFFAYLKKAEKQLKLMGNQMGQVVAARNNFMENLNNCNTVMLPDYEKNVYSEYLGEAKRQPVLLFVHDHKVQDNIRNLRDNSVGKPNPFSLFYDMLVFQARQVQVFQQVILTKQSFQQNRKKLQEKCLSSQAQIAKLMGGKTTFKSIFSRGSKNEQIQSLEKEIPEMQKEIEYLGEFCELINCIVSSVEIPEFKRIKQKQYYDLLSKTSDQELNFLAAYGTFMKSIMEGLNKTVVKF